MGDPAGEDEARMNPLDSFASSHSRRADSLFRDREYRGPNGNVNPSWSGILSSYGRCGGSWLAFDKVRPVGVSGVVGYREIPKPTVGGAARVDNEVQREQVMK